MTSWLEEYARGPNNRPPGTMDAAVATPSGGSGKGGIGGAFNRFNEWNRNNPQFMAQAAASLNNMTLRPNAALQDRATMLMQEKSKNDRVKKQSNATAEKLRAWGYPEYADYIIANPESTMDVLKVVMDLRAEEASRDSYEGMTVGEWAERSGIDPSTLDPSMINRPMQVEKGTNKAQVLGGGGQNINIPPAVGAPASGYQNVYDDAGRILRQEMIPGGPAELEYKENEARKGRKYSVRGVAAGTVVQDFERALNLLGDIDPTDEENSLAVLARGISSMFPGSDAAEIERNIASGKANIGIDQLQQMRENNETGGALGQVPVQQQLRLETLLGNVSVWSRKQISADNIKRVQNIYLDIMYGSEEERQELIEQGKMSPEENARVRTLYKPLSFDQQGKPFNLDEAPPSIKIDGQDDLTRWRDLPPELRMRAWTQYDQRYLGGLRR